MAFIEDEDDKGKRREGSIVDELVGQAASFVSQAEIDQSSGQDYDRETEYFDGVMKDLDGEEDGDTGRSQAVSRDVADTIGWIMPQLMRIFMGADNTVDFEPENAEDEDAVDDAEMYINQLFRRKGGYRLLWDGIHDTLLHRTGILKATWDHSKEYEERVIEDMDDVAWTELLDDDDVEVLTHEERSVTLPAEMAAPDNPMMAAMAMAMKGAGAPPMPGNPAMPSAPPMPGMPPMGAGPNMGLPPGMGAPLLLDTVKVHSGKVRKVKSHGRLAISVIPRDQFLIEQDVTSMKESSGTGEMRTLRRSDLIEMGFDRDKVMAIPASSSVRNSTGRYDENWSSPAEGGKEIDEIDYFELYLRRDLDNDGIAETVKACFAGDVCRAGLLDWEEWEEDTLPYTELTSEPVPHRFSGRSIFDATEDVMKIKTVLTRNLMDTSYDSADPMMQVNLDALDPDYADESLKALQNPSAEHRLVYGSGGQPVATPLIENIGDAAAMMGILAMQDAVLEKRTGVSRATAALDPETLQNQSATAANLQHSAQYSKVELIARNMAELGLKQFFGIVYRLVVKYEQGVKRVRIGKKQWRDVEPSTWPKELGVLVNVGLGTGNRDRDTQGLMSIRTTQMGYVKELGPDNPYVTIDQVRRTDEKIMQAMGIRNADAFITQPSEEEVNAWKEARAAAAQQPPPQIAAQMQADKAKMEMQATLDREKMKLDFDLEMARIKAKSDLDRIQMEAEIALKREQLQAELRMQGRLALANANGPLPSNVQLGGVPG